MQGGHFKRVILFKTLILLFICAWCINAEPYYILFGSLNNRNKCSDVNKLSKINWKYLSKVQLPQMCT